MGKLPHFLQKKGRNIPVGVPASQHCKAEKIKKLSGVARSKGKNLQGPVKRTTFGKIIKSNVVPVEDREKLEKGKYAKIAGTRIQTNKRGIPVRVIIEGGKEFPPDNVQAVKRHFKKMEKEAQEAEHVAKLRGDEAPAKKGSFDGKPKVNKVQVKSDRDKHRELRKDTMKRKSQDLHNATIKEEGREIVSPDVWYRGEVLSKGSGRAVVKVSDAASVSSSVLQRLKDASHDLASSPQSSADDLLIAVRFGDIAVPMNLQPGLRVKFKLYTDKKGGGGCEAGPCEGSTTAAEVSSPAKRAKIAGSPVSSPAKRAKIAGSPAKGAAEAPPAVA